VSTVTTPVGAHERTALSTDSRTRAAVARALTRTEARRLLRHPSVLIGVALAVLVIRTAASGNILSDADGHVALGLVPLAWATTIATNLSVLRGRHDGTGELYESMPSPPTARTLAHLLSGWVAAGAGAVVLLGWLALEWWAGGTVGSPNVAELVVGPLLVAGAAALGVLVARWVPHPLVGALLVVATVFVQGKLSESGASPFRWMAFVVEGGADDGQSFPGPVDWHVAYLGGTVMIAGVLAIARHGVQRRVAVWLAVAVGVTGLAAVAQTRPLPDAEVRRQAALLTHPDLECETRAGVRYCTRRHFGARVGQWEGPVQGVLARVPGEVRDRGLVVSMRDLNVVSNANCTPTPRLRLLPERVRARVDPTLVWPADGAVHPDKEWPWDEECSFTDHGVALTVQVGAWAVGLPPAQAATSSPCVASGQARSVIALWLAGQSTPGGARGLTDIGRGSGPGTTLNFGESANWPSWGVAYAKLDLAVALALLERPADEVGRLALDHWTRLVDPSASTGELTALAGLPPTAAGPDAVPTDSDALPCP
jgi:hypothetical protein